MNKPVNTRGSISAILADVRPLAAPPAVDPACTLPVRVEPPPSSYATARADSRSRSQRRRARAQARWERAALYRAERAMRVESDESRLDGTGMGATFGDLADACREVRLSGRDGACRLRAPTARVAVASTWTSGGYADDGCYRSARTPASVAVPTPAAPGWSSDDRRELPAAENATERRDTVLVPRRTALGEIRATRVLRNRA